MESNPLYSLTFAMPNVIATSTPHRKAAVGSPSAARRLFADEDHTSGSGDLDSGSGAGSAASVGRGGSQAHGGRPGNDGKRKNKSKKKRKKKRKNSTQQQQQQQQNLPPNNTTENPTIAVVGANPPPAGVARSSPDFADAFPTLAAATSTAPPPPRTQRKSRRIKPTLVSVAVPASGLDSGLTPSADAPPVGTMGGSGLFIGGGGGFGVFPGRSALSVLPLPCHPPCRRWATASVSNPS